MSIIDKIRTMMNKRMMFYKPCHIVYINEEDFEHLKNNLQLFYYAPSGKHSFSLMGMKVEVTKGPTRIE